LKKVTLTLVELTLYALLSQHCSSILMNHHSSKNIFL